MTKTTESVTYIHASSAQAGAVPTTETRTTTVYKKKDGKEWACYKKKYFQVSRVDVNGLCAAQVTV